MKIKVLVIGKNSYIGNSFINKYGDEYEFYEFDSLQPLSKDIYVGYDVVLHLAGIAHVSSKKSMDELYFRVNRDLAIESCNFAKEAGCKLFIFMSSMIIYGNDYRIGKEKVITTNTVPRPNNSYGQSKLDADYYISSQNNEEAMKTLVIRTPMVYGAGSKGNYPKLLSLSNKLPFTPNIKNKRSVIEINNLCTFFDVAIKEQFSGVYYPQDPEFMCTSAIMAQNRINNGKKARLTKLFNPLIKFGSLFSNKLKKMFGTKIYDIGEIHKNGVKY